MRHRGKKAIYAPNINFPICERASIYSHFLDPFLWYNATANEALTTSLSLLFPRRRYYWPPPDMVKALCSIAFSHIFRPRKSPRIFTIFFSIFFHSASFFHAYSMNIAPAGDDIHGEGYLENVNGAFMTILRSVKPTIVVKENILKKLCSSFSLGMSASSASGYFIGLVEVLLCTQPRPQFGLCI